MGEVENMWKNWSSWRKGNVVIKEFQVIKNSGKEKEMEDGQEKRKKKSIKNIYSKELLLMTWHVAYYVSGLLH